MYKNYKELKQLYYDSLSSKKLCVSEKLNLSAWFSFYQATCMHYKGLNVAVNKITQITFAGTAYFGGYDLTLFK